MRRTYYLVEVELAEAVYFYRHVQLWHRVDQVEPLSHFFLKILLVPVRRVEVKGCFGLHCELGRVVQPQKVDLVRLTLSCMLFFPVVLYREGNLNLEILLNFLTTVKTISEVFAMILMVFFSSRTVAILESK